MAEGNTDCQMSACEKFFPKQFKPLKDVVAEQLKGSGYDITMFDAHEVVTLLSQIVNDQKQFKDGNNFLFSISNGKETEELFQLEAKPTDDQPGNGRLSLLKWKMEEIQEAKTYAQLLPALKDYYKNERKSFASHIKKLFRNNEEVTKEDIPQVTFETYMILLFEIARRSVVTVENPTERRKQLDNLPIGIAVARLVELLELGNEEICSFDDVFHPDGKFHCFARDPIGRRRKAIDEINKTTLIPIDKVNESTHLQELSKMFYSEERQKVDMVAEKMERNLNVKD